MKSQLMYLLDEGLD